MKHHRKPILPQTPPFQPINPPAQNWPLSTLKAQGFRLSTPEPSSRGSVLHIYCDIVVPQLNYRRDERSKAGSTPLSNKEESQMFAPPLPRFASRFCLGIYLFVFVFAGDEYWSFRSRCKFWCLESWRVDVFGGRFGFGHFVCIRKFRLG